CDGPGQGRRHIKEDHLQIPIWPKNLGSSYYIEYDYRMEALKKLKQQSIEDR
ncbi:hypothetical protein HAX54_012661, partial [Datura stramonium]|nr:hypothetical protein [Datura stramonium]